MRKIAGFHHFQNFAFLILSLCSALLGLIEPFFISMLLDQLTQTEFVLSQFLFYMSAVVVSCLLRIAFGYVKNLYIIRLRNYAVKKISLSLFEKVIHQKKQQLETRTPTYLTSRIMDDTLNLDGIFNYSLIDSCISLILCCSVFWLMTSHSWLISMTTFFFIAADYMIALSLPLTNAYRDYNEGSATIKAETANLIQGAFLIQLGERYQAEGAAYGKRMEQFLYSLRRRDTWRQAQRSSGAVCRQVGYAAVISISAVLMLKKNLSVGSLVMLLSLYNTVWNHAYITENYMPLYKQAKAACERIVEILNSVDEPVRLAEEAEAKQIKCIAMEHVFFGYQRERLVLNGISWKAKKGEITSIAGYSGCGKSTIFSLLLGFLQPNEGKILVNDVEITGEGLRGLRGKIGFVSQDCFLFNRSIKDNLLYYVEENAQTVEAMNQYLEDFGLNEWIAALPLGVETKMCEKAATISGGEKQRLCIIRELLKNPAILLLDECTSQIDSDTEQKIMELLRKLCRDKIVLQISHRSAVLENSDLVYVLGQGQMIEQGLHSELIARSAFYRNLINRRQIGMDN